MKTEKQEIRKPWNQDFLKSKYLVSRKSFK